MHASFDDTRLSFSGTKLLQSMGWKEGQGIGPRVSLKQRRDRSRKKTAQANTADQEEDLDDQDAQHSALLSAKVAPLDVNIANFAAQAKMDRYGIGFDPIKNAPEMSCKKPLGTP